MDNNLILTNKEAANFLSIKPATLAKWRSEHRGPRYSKLGRRIVYKVQDLEEYLKQNKIETLDTENYVH